jgi:hypothetical protein
MGSETTMWVGSTSTTEGEGELTLELRTIEPGVDAAASTDGSGDKRESCGALLM